MKIIFLDVDGVLNHQLWYESKQYTHATFDDVNVIARPAREKEEYEKSQFCPRAVGLLNTLTESTKAKIVVSSSWRHGRSVEELKRIFEMVGIKGEVIDKTPSLHFTGIEDYHYSVPRGCEIKAWLEINKGMLGSKITLFKYVILDDDSDMLYWQRNNYIQVDSYCGLTPQVIYKVQRLLAD